MALFAGLQFSNNKASAQTLMYRFPFDAANSTAIDTTSDGTGLLPPITLQFLEFVAAGTTNSVDLRGGANSGVQGQGESLNFTNSPNPATTPAVLALATNNASLASMGDGATPGSSFSNFTATVWVKMPEPVTSPVDTQGGVIWMVGVNGANAPGTANTIAFRINSRAGANNGITNTFLARISGASVISAPLYFTTPTNLWMYFAVVYNATNKNAYIYYGTEGSPAKLVGIKNIGAQTFSFGATATLNVGNIVNTYGRHFEGFVDDLRFYAGGGGAANAAFVEGVRQERTPVVISGLYPDGTSLLEGTNTLAFVASSANGIDPARIAVAVNGTDVSGGLLFRRLQGARCRRLHFRFAGKSASARR